MLFDPLPSAPTGLIGAGLEVLTKDMAMVAVAGAAGVALFLMLIMFMVKNFLYICRPNEALIFTGRRRFKDGVDLGPLVILGRGHDNQAPEHHGCGRGRAWRVPLLERVDHLDMSAMSIDISVNNAYSVGNIPLRIHAIANVKISSDPKLIRNAIERFLGQSIAEIQTVARQTLEGALREVLAQMTPEAVNEDRLAFAENLVKSAQDDLDKLGLHLDTLKIQHVSDETGYLDSLGRPLIAAVLRDAEKAESQASQEVSEAQAEANRRAETAKALAETAILMKRNNLQQMKSELDGAALAIEREAEAAAKTARATAEQELQGVRGQLEEKRLMAEVIIPAEVKRAAEAVLAKGAAAPTIEHGAAIAEVLQVTGEAWKAMGSKAKEIYVIQHLEEILDTVIDSVDKIKVREVTVLDRGDGTGIASYAASFPHAVAAVLTALRETTGVDVPAILAGDRSSK
jgi:flotillin